jgi:hypothetical protein
VEGEGGGCHGSGLPSFKARTKTGEDQVASGSRNWSGWWRCDFGGAM